MRFHEVRPSRRSTTCPRGPAACRSSGRSTRTAAARMPASTASRGRRTSTWTQRGAGLRARDHRQGQRARGAAQGARAAVVAGRADRAGHEHGPVPVGRGPLQAHARHLGGDARLPQPVLDPDQVAAAAARPGPAEGDRRGRGRQRLPVGPDAGREGLAGDRAAHAEPEGAPGGGGRAQPRRHPDGRADRAADARVNDAPRAGRADRRGGDRGAARPTSAARRCSCAAPCARSSSSGCASTARTWSSATRGSTPRARYLSAGRRAQDRARPPARRGCAGGPTRYAYRHPAGRCAAAWLPAPRPAEARSQESLF